MVELLISLLLASFFLGVFVLRMYGGFTADPEDARCKEAALEACDWFRGVLIRAKEGREPFSLKVTLSSRSQTLRVVWFKTNRWETFDAGGRAFFIGSGYADLITYYPNWHTFSPGVSLGIYSSLKGGRLVGNLVITPLGAVRLDLWR
ncbi:hypothetical protein TheveDRAFT_1189 [Thermanaerovibrio velox DSM 12556]|uniref:Prepilin-type N-terminal cleavage/methylation domain-containing protein n=1 Tax=Thermanaerovibrio velox DSM 12556 TaxID=926567 RepID=H0USM4_9BACT|nr:hypothetical protein [Thermanaerovibrio velox]EHM10313.1 hypothetical protein TheveDRAFT_1189 [Thermanaerovibrio velox DSM 12556]